MTTQVQPEPTVGEAPPEAPKLEPQIFQLYAAGKLRQLRKVSQNGNSWAVSLPREFLRVLNAGAGDYLELHMADSRTLVIRKYQPIERKRTTDER